MSYVLHAANVREYARRLHEQNGWSAYRIRKALTGRVDPLPSEWAIRTWIDDDLREEVNRAKRRYGKPGPPRKRAWRLRLERMRELRDLGLSYRSIAAVMSNDFEDLDLDTERVRFILKGCRESRTVRRLLWPQGAKA